MFAGLRTTRAFSLVELMVTVAIISILATMALPAYYTMIRNVHRVEASGLLSDVYGMESAYFAANNRYGCFTEIGFRMEGQGHFAIWICDETEGCQDGACPCIAAPDDWIAPSGGSTNLLVPRDTALALALPPIFAAFPTGTATGGWSPTPTPAGSPTPAPGPNPFDPGAGPPILPVDLPVTCAELQSAQTFEAGADNWCRRAIPQVVDIYWLATISGRTVFYDPLPQDPADMSQCQ